eukprot:CAMPEP_0206264432 /NCGR_PEP_ID=MMETSP0047_2-20121206/29399_1 /ASSEMBLY_ACC=CAM_ASM_000192 /TAXON_ID=195065 /ORGANISM="Chroomonas mesostigmatica_cf, Strain CCMP1168" /LENGTH=755 /DNA_ID=CAMNT_0053692141 /DNA_START=85 /DNA_END=2352 /DNA_ORIENTATION=+
MSKSERDTVPMLELSLEEGAADGGGDTKSVAGSRMGAPHSGAGTGRPHGKAFEENEPRPRRSLTKRMYDKVQERRVGLVGIAAIFLILVLVLIVAEASYEAHENSLPTNSTPAPGATPDPLHPYGLGEARVEGVLAVGATAATHHLAAEAGMEALRAGGTAADAAAAIQFVLTVVQPFSTGIGGGFFAMLYNGTTGKVETIDAREEAPSAFHPNIFCKDSACQYGPCNCSQGTMDSSDAVYSSLSMGIPGTPRGVEKLIKNHGKLTLKDALRPAIKIAREGWEYYELFDTVVRTSRLLQPDKQRPHFKEAAKLLLNDEGTAPRYKVGDTMKNPQLAGTLQLLADKGIDEFYQGTLAREMIAAMRNATTPDGRFVQWTMEDLRQYRAVYRRPINTTYRGDQVLGMASPSSGGIAIGQMLNLLEGVDFSNMKFQGLEHLATKLQAENLAFADRNKYVADADFVEMPVSWSNDQDCRSYTLETCPSTCKQGARECEAKGLLSKSYARERRGQYMSHPYPHTPLPAGEFDTSFTMAPPQVEHGTTHLVATDRFGNVVSMTTTIEGNFGSMMAVPGRGFFVNNEMTDFSFTSTSEGKPVANAPSGQRLPRRTAVGEDRDTIGGKRPRSSMSPTIILRPDGKPRLVLGSPGGSYIIGAVHSVALAVLDFGVGVKEAIDATRVWGRNLEAMQLEGKENCRCEGSPFTDAALRGGLEALGFRLNQASPTTRPFVQALSFAPDGKGVVAGADTRRCPKAGAYAE